MRNSSLHLNLVSCEAESNVERAIADSPYTVNRTVLIKNDGQY